MNTKKRKNKNIIIIIMDAVRVKNLSLYGYEKETDPNLKKIAKESIVFGKHFSCSNFTFPSLISLLSGRYPNKHGMIHQFPYYAREEFSKFKKNKSWLPSLLKKKGYSTIGIGYPGLWLKKGFDYYKEKEKKEVKESKLKKIMNTVLIRKLLLSLPGWAYKFLKGTFKTRSTVKFPYAHETVDLAVKKIKEARKPFFQLIHFQNTHIPFRTTKKIKSSKKDAGKILSKIKSKSQKEYVKKRFADLKLYSIEDIKNKYDLAIKEVDEQIGRLVGFLKKENLWKNTIFIITSDHGLSLNENKIYFSSAGLYNETLHIPLIMHIPGFKAEKIGGLMQSVDIAPTVLEILNLNKPGEIDGASALPLIKNNKEIRKKAYSFDGLAEDIRVEITKNKKKIFAEKNLCYLCKARHHKLGRYEIKS